MGRETEAAMLVQAFMASMQTLQVFISASLDGLRYLVNNTFVMVSNAHKCRQLCLNSVADCVRRSFRHARPDILARCESKPSRGED